MTRDACNLRGDPLCCAPVSYAAIVEDLERRDPELVEASHEVDHTLLRWSLRLTPLERLRACTRNTTTLEALRRGTRLR